MPSSPPPRNERDCWSEGAPPHRRQSKAGSSAPSVATSQPGRMLLSLSSIRVTSYPFCKPGPWSWQVVEEEARKPEHQGSFSTYLVSEPRSIGHCPPILVPSTATCRKKSGEGDSRPRLVEGTSEPGGEIIILATIYWVHNQGQILSPVLYIH